MKIAFVSDAAYPWNVGGLETLERLEAEALAKKHDVHFFSFRWPRMSNDFVDESIHYHAFHEISKDKFYRHGRRSIREALVFSVGILRIFRYKFDIIQTNEFPVIHIPALKIYCMVTGCKLIIDVHEVWEWAYWTKYIGKFKGGLAFLYATFALKMGDQYIANSSVTAGSLEHIGIDKSRINLFSPVIDDKLVSRITERKGRKVIIFAGRLIKEKRLDKWLAVLKKIRAHSKVKGMIIGEGPEEKRIAKKIKKMGLLGSVKLRHFYKDKYQMYEKIKESALLLHMSEREGLGMVILDSVALGTPVLLPKYSPVPDDIKQMCTVVDESKLAETAIKIMHGPKERYVKHEETMDRYYVSKTSQFYEGLLRKMNV